MFSKIKSFVKNLFSAKVEEKSPGPAKQAKKKKHTPKAAPPPAKPKPKKKKAAVQAAPAVKEEKKVIPPRPEKLADVPLCENKVRFLDYALHEDVQFGIQHIINSFHIGLHAHNSSSGVA